MNNRNERVDHLSEDELGGGPSSRPDRTRFLRPGYRSEGTQLSINEKNSILDEALEKILPQWEVDNPVGSAIACIKDIKDIAKNMGDCRNPWHNIEEKRVEIQNKILDKVSNGVLQRWEVDNPVGIAIACTKDIKDITKNMDNFSNPWYNIEEKKRFEIQNKILDKVSNGVLQRWEVDNPVGIAIACIKDIKDITKNMDNFSNPWHNIEEKKRVEIQNKILDKALEESWKGGKGKSFAERSTMCQEAVRATAIAVGYNIDEVVNKVNNDLGVKDQAIKSDSERWRASGLPGRGWPGKNYESEQAMLSASDREIIRAISTKTGVDEYRMQKLYWNRNIKKSLNIDTSKMEDLTYEKMYDYLIELEAAENELRQKVKKVCLFEYIVKRSKRLKAELFLPARGSGLNREDDLGSNKRVKLDQSGRYVNPIEQSDPLQQTHYLREKILGDPKSQTGETSEVGQGSRIDELILVFVEFWLAPAENKYDAALKATEEAYKRILSPKERPPDNRDPL